MITTKKLLKLLLKAEKQGLLNADLFYPVFDKPGAISIALHIDIDNSFYLGNIIEQDKARVLSEHQSYQHKQDHETNQQNKPKNKANRCTYLMIDKRNGLYKIGKSKHPEQRERTLQSEVPQIELIDFCAEGIVSESELHKCFQSKRVRGEWFRLDANDILTIKNLMQS